MKLYIKGKRNSTNAIAEYDVINGKFVVLKGSVVSNTIAHSSTFRGAKSIEKQRANGNVIDGVVDKDVVFKSPSTAANFVTGASTNGLIAWKNEKGTSLKELLKKDGHDE